MSASGDCPYPSQREHSPRSDARVSGARYVVVSALAWLGACGNVHTDNKTEVRRDECVSCHLDEQRAALSPPHFHAGFGDDCASCHQEQSWRPAPGFTHTEKFSLTLGHQGPSCADCHSQGYTPGKIPNQCVQCHADRAAQVQNPVHAGLSQSCFACHRTDSFKPAHFVHSWPLKGQHAMTPCVSCHTGNPARYEQTSSACIDCHLDDRTRADKSIKGHDNFPNACESCHGFDKF